MKIVIDTIPHNDQRYETCGDWWWEDGGNTLQVRVSKLDNWKQEMCVAFHEMFEALVCKKQGISEEKITKFDMEFEEERSHLEREDWEEPGMSVDAPYRKPHQLATGVELILATSLDVVWSEYEHKVNLLSQDIKLK